MKRILIFVNYYYPGYKAGGPIRTVSNLVHYLGDRYKFMIITMDRDLDDEQSFSNITPNQWNSIGKADVFYISPENIRYTFLKRIINQVSFDLYYLNSFFNPYFTLLPLFMRFFSIIPVKPVLIAPRGEMVEGALSINSSKKKLFLLVFRFFGFHKKVCWHATNQYELEGMERTLGKNVQILKAPNLPSQKEISHTVVSHKQKGKLNIAFISRISPKKNLDFALRTLQPVEGEIVFKIYGPNSDERYWKDCLQIVSQLPENIEVKYMGSIDNKYVSEVLTESDLMFLPTKGENYGHVIYEALSSGCPVLISDQTPWHQVQEYKAGWELSLDEKGMFSRKLQDFVDMDQETHKCYKNGALDYAKIFFNDSLIQENIQLFNSIST